MSNEIKLNKIILKSNQIISLIDSAINDEANNEETRLALWAAKELQKKAMQEIINSFNIKGYVQSK